jgi:protein SCO1/2
MKTSSANALLAVLIGLSAAPSAFAQDDRPAILRDLGFDQHLGEALPLDARFVDASGQAVRLGDYFGEKPIVVALVYYECPMLCTLTLNGLESAMSVLRFDVGDQYDVVTVSFEPRETPELARAKKAAYVERYGRAGAAEGWHFLTGDAEQIGRLTDALGFRYAWDEETQQYAHPSGIVIVTPDGKIARYLYGIEYAPKDLRLGLVEASEGKIGSPVDAFLLFCYQYDPKTGRYGAAVVNLLRGSAVLTLLVLISFWFVMWRRERMAQVAGLAQERRA